VRKFDRSSRCKTGLSTRNIACLPQDFWAVGIFGPLGLGRPFDGLRSQVGRAGRSAIFATAAFESTDDPHRHVLFAQDLATESDCGESSGFKYLFFSNGHFRRFAREELDAAGGASGVAAAGMELIARGLFSQGIDEPFAGRDFEFAETFDSEFWHSISCFAEFF